MLLIGLVMTACYCWTKNNDFEYSVDMPIEQYEMYLGADGVMSAEECSALCTDALETFEDVSRCEEGMVEDTGGVEIIHIGCTGSVHFNCM